MQFDDVANDSESETEAAVLPRRAAIALPASFEQMRRYLRIEADARVVDDEAQLIAFRPELNVDPPPAARELDGVGHEIPDHLLQPVGIDLNWADGGVERQSEHDVLGFGRRAQRLDRRFDDLLHRCRPWRDLKFARHDLRDIEQILDEPRLRPASALDGLNCAFRLCRVELAAREQARPSEHGIERSTQFVGQCEEEFVFQVVGGFRLMRLFVRNHQRSLVTLRQPGDVAPHPARDNDADDQRADENREQQHDRADMLHFPEKNGRENADGDKRCHNQMAELSPRVRWHNRYMASSSGGTHTKKTASMRPATSHAEVCLA